MTREPRTEAGKRMLWMLAPTYENGTRIRAFDARLTSRIVEDFVVRIEDEANAGEFPDEPIYLGCGCLDGTHPNDTAGWQAAHPDHMYPADTRAGMRFYGASSRREEI